MGPGQPTVLTLVRWLRMPAETFLVEQVDSLPPAELTAELAPLLRARTDLDEADVAMLQEVI
jgi:hypothetical protein